MSKKFAKSVLITGSNRGLGLQFVKQLACQVDIVFAGCRMPADAKELNILAKQHNNIHLVELDVVSEASIKSCFETVKKISGESGLACLINNSGRNDKADNKLDGMSFEKFNDIFSVNTFAPAMISKTFLSLIKQAAANTSSENVVHKGLIVNISSGLGSIEMLTKEKSVFYTYNMSKAALNMLTKIMAFELEEHNIDVVGIHPGWVQTDMGGASATYTTEESVESMLKVLTSFKKEENGLMLDVKGGKLPF